MERPSLDKFTWTLPEYEGRYDADIEATLHHDRVEFVMYTYNPNYGGAAGIGTLSFATLLASGPPEPLTRAMCGDLLHEVERRSQRWDQLPPVSVAGPQFSLCPSCDGGRACWLCRGSGLLSTGDRCGECLGRRYCIGCDGAGIIPKGP